MYRSLALSAFVLLSACGGKSPKKESVTVEEAAPSPAPVPAEGPAPAPAVAAAPTLASLTSYTCIVQSSNTTVASEPLWTETFDFSSADIDISKSVAVTSPAATIAARVVREDNSVGSRINLQIYNQTTDVMVIAQYADGDRDLHVLYKPTSDATIELYCAAQSLRTVTAVKAILWENDAAVAGYMDLIRTTAGFDALRAGAHFFLNLDLEVAHHRSDGMKDFLAKAPQRLLLMAPGEADVLCDIYGGSQTDSSTKLFAQAVHIAESEFAKMKPGIAYSVSPVNADAFSHRWVIPESLKVTRP